MDSMFLSSPISSIDSWLDLFNHIHTSGSDSLPTNSSQYWWCDMGGGWYGKVILNLISYGFSTYSLEIILYIYCYLDFTPWCRNNTLLMSWICNRFLRKWRIGDYYWRIVSYSWYFHRSFYMEDIWKYLEIKKFNNRYTYRGKINNTWNQAISIIVFLLTSLTYAYFP